MKIDMSLPTALGRHHPLRRLAMRDVFALCLLAAIVVVLFGVTELYYIAYSHYRASIGLPTDNSPVITLPTVRRH
jgi:hypothetical protein